MLRRARRPPVLLAGAGLLVLAVVDVVTSTPGWAYAVLLGVPVAAVLAVTRGPRERDASALSAVVLSGAGSAVLAVEGYHFLGTWGLAESASMLVLLTDRIRHAARRRDGVLPVLIGVAVVAQALRAGLADAAVYTCLLAVAVAVAATTGSALRAADGQRRGAVAAVRRAERAAIARELHDVVAHHVTGMVVATQAARAVAPEAVPPAVASSLAAIEAAGSEALASMRRLVEVLRGDPDADPEETAARLPVAGTADLADLVARFRSSGSAEEVRLVVDPDGEPLPAEVQAGIYRVVQESLTNVRRHAPGAAHVVVDVARSTGGVAVRVRNGAGRTGGAGAAVEPAGGGFGVLGMQERVDALGGSLRAGHDGDGWAVEAFLPTRARAGTERLP